MARKQLGEFEELILLMVGILYEEAYGVAIKQEIEKQTGRVVRISAVHVALSRLEEKGYAHSSLGGGTAKRGGRRKRIFTLTQAGKLALDEVREVRNRLWNQIPNISFS